MLQKEKQQIANKSANKTNEIPISNKTEFDEMTHSEMKNRIHELQIQNAELQTQNDVLRKITTELEKSNDNYMEKNLQQSESILHTVIDAHPVFIAYLNPEQRYRFANKSYEKCFGFSNEEMKGKHVKEILGEEYYDKIRKYNEIVLSGKQVHFEITRTVNDQTYYYDIILAPQIDKMNHVEGYFVLGNDITDRKLADTALQKIHDDLEKKITEKTADFSIINEILQIKVEMLEKIEDKLRLHNQITTNVSEGIFLIRASDGIIVYANPKFEKMFGYDHNELIDKSISIVNAPSETGLGESTTVIMKSLLENGVWEGEVYNIKKDGTTFWCYATISTFEHNEHGPVWVSIHIDITDRKKAEEEQKHLIDVLENTNQQLKDFAHIVSHELKRPLVTVRTRLELLSIDLAGKLNKESQEHIDLMIRKLDQLNQIINSILQYSSIGWLEEEIIAIDLKQIIATASEFIDSPKNVHIRIENKLPTIWFEKTRILQIFQNLLYNAVKYIDKQIGVIKIGCVEEGDFWKFWVTDNGRGIEKKDFKRIFQIFQRVDDSSGSTGVGLAVVKRIVEMYEGEIWVESKVGLGSTFFFTLPNDIL